MRRAFTLVELLVVIGVIAVLIGLLLPALNAARQQSRAVACLSNLRQLAQAATAYTVENQGYYPPSRWIDGAISYNWDFTNDNGTVVPGLLWAGQSNPQVQQCPSFDGASNAAGDPYTGYNYNASYIGPGTGEGVPVRMSRVRKPAETALFGDGQWIGGANKYMRSPLPSPTENPFAFAAGSALKAAGTQGFRHRGKTNIAFADGHAESLKERFGVGVAPGTGFISADNSLYDLQ
jgi:prepilin-type processing-associated H-X9-DG protein/prepilin-type N-terminal cleavage/methylation domain-containing protein